MEARPQRRTKAGRLVSTITREELESCFHMPSEQACRHLGVGLTILKRVCRRFGIPRWPYNRQGRQQMEDGSGDSCPPHGTGAAGSNAGTQGMAPLPAFGAALPQPAAGQQEQPAYRAPLPSLGAALQPSYGAPALPVPGLQGFGQPPPAPLPPPQQQQQQPVQMDWRQQQPAQMDWRQQQPAQMDWQQQLQTVLSSLLPQQPAQPVAPAPPPQPSLGSVLGSILGGPAGPSQWSDGTHFAPPPLHQLPMGQGTMTLAAVQQLASLLQQQQTAVPQQLQAPQAQQAQHLLQQVQQHIQQPQQEQQQVQQHIQQAQQQHIQQQQHAQQQHAQQQHAQQQQEQPPLDGFAAFAPAAQALVSAPSVVSAGAAAASGAASGSVPGRQDAQNPALLGQAPGDDSSYNQLALAVQRSGGLETAVAATTDMGGSAPGDASVGPASEAQPQQSDAGLPTEELVRQLAAALPDLSHTAALLRKAAEQLQAHLSAQRLLQGEAAALSAQLPGASVLAGPNAEVAELCVTTLLNLLDGVGKKNRSGAAAGAAAAAQPGPEPFAPAASPLDEQAAAGPAGAGLPNAATQG